MIAALTPILMGFGQNLGDLFAEVLPDEVGQAQMVVWAGGGGSIGTDTYIMVSPCF